MKDEAINKAVDKILEQSEEDNEGLYVSDRYFVTSKKHPKLHVYVGGLEGKMTKENQSRAVEFVKEVLATLDTPLDLDDWATGQGTSGEFPYYLPPSDRGDSVTLYGYGEEDYKTLHQAWKDLKPLVKE